MDKFMYEETRLKYAHRARSFGIAAIASSLILYAVPYIAIGLGFLAILFALLSKGYKPKIDKDAKFGVIFATVGIVISVGVLGSTLYKFFNDVEYRNTILSTIEELYGDEYEELYGEDIGDMWDSMTGGNGDVDL